MDEKTTLIVVDTDIFIRDLRYSRDRESKINRGFLDTIHSQGNAATTIVNLLEICGILSFNLSPSQLKELFFHFPRRYKVDVLPLHSLEDPLPELGISNIFERIGTKLSFGCADRIRDREIHTGRRRVRFLERKAFSANSHPRCNTRRIPEMTLHDHTHTPVKR